MSNVPSGVENFNDVINRPAVEAAAEAVAATVDDGSGDAAVESEEMLKALEEIKKLTVALGFTHEDAAPGVRVLAVEHFLAQISSLSAGDVISKVDGEDCPDAASLLKHVEGKMAGEMVKLHVTRKFDNAEDVLVLEVPTTDDSVQPSQVRQLRVAAALPVNADPLPTKESALKLLQDMPTRVGFRIVESAEGEQGVVISVLNPGTPSVYSGALVNDRITAVNGTAVSNTESFIAAVQPTIAGDALTFDVVREGAQVTLKSEMGLKNPEDRQEYVRALRQLAGLPVLAE